MRFLTLSRIIVILIASITFALSVATIVGIILHGRVHWEMGDITVLRASHLGLPLTMAFLSLVVLLLALRRRWFDQVLNHLSLRDWLLGILLFLAGYAGISGRHTLHGDGREYILQTQALVFDNALAINPEARSVYWNKTNPYGVKLGQARPPAKILGESSQAGGGFGGLYPDRFGNYRYYHFWVYSAVVAPVYLLFHFLDPSGDLEYFSFRFVNVCLLLAFFFCAYRQKPHWTALAILGLLLCSPLIPYCDWQHPEICCLTLVFLAFYLATNRKAVFASPLFLGLAGSMNPPILLFLPGHFLFALMNLESRRAVPLAKLSAGYLAGIILGLSSPAYYMYYFHTPSVIAHIKLASLDYASLARVTDIFFSPIIGAALFFPLALLAIPACITRKNWMTLGVVLASVTAAAWLASSTANLNAGQVGTVRYAVWLLAPLWYYLFRYVPERFSFSPRGWFLSAALGLSVCLILYLRTYELFAKDIRRFGGCWRARPEVAALMRALPYYNGDAEVIVENIMGKELPNASRFKDIYVWDLGRDNYLWILSESAIARRHPLIFQTEVPQKISVTISPQQPVQVLVEGNIIRVELADPPPRMYRHPVLGNYLVLRSRGRITKILKNQRFIIRSDIVEQVDSLDENGRAERANSRK